MKIACGLKSFSWSDLTPLPEAFNFTIQYHFHESKITRVSCIITTNETEIPTAKLKYKQENFKTLQYATTNPHLWIDAL